jgi:hypothetical protein
MFSRLDAPAEGFAMRDDSPIPSLAAWPGVVVVIVEFEGSALLGRVLRARGVRVTVLDSLSEAIAVLTTLPAAVLVVRLGLDGVDGERAITLVVRNFRTLGILRDSGKEDTFADRFGEFFPGPVDTPTLGAAIMRHATLSTNDHHPVRRSVA